MALSFTTTAKAAEDNGLKFLVYGPSGMGKTALVSTLPNPFLISAESGMLSLSRKNIERIHGAGRSDIAYEIPALEIKTFSDLLEAYTFVSTSKHAAAFDSFALDSVSDIAEVVLTNAKKLVKDPRQAYGDLIEKMTRILRDFRDLKNKHVYFSAKQDREIDAGTNVMLYSPMMPGKELSKQLPYFFDEVFALGITAKDASGKQSRFLRTATDLQFQAKDRSGALAEFEAPHLGAIIAKIKQT